MKKIMIDMDDVITDGTFRKQIEEYIGEAIDTNKTGYYLQNALGSRKEEFFRKGPLDMYEDAPLKEGAYEVIERLNSVYEVYIVTSYEIPDAHYQEGNHLKFKMEYLQKHLPFLKTSQIIFLNDKTLIDFAIRIDDSIRHLVGGETLMLFDSYSNQHLTKEELEKQNVRRVMNWQEIGVILLDGEV